MKTRIITLLGILFISVQLAYAEGDKEVKIKTSAICEMCKERIERNLGLSKGVKGANLDLNNKVVTVKYNPSKTSPDAIKTTIVETGYDADDLPAATKAYNKLPGCCKKTSAKH